jgi:thioredoxin 2
MTESIHVVCPHCTTTNRVPEGRLADRPTCGRCKGALFLGKPLNLTAVDLDKHLTRGDLPLVVDFWAPWCGPCRVMAPAFEQAAVQFEPRLRLGKVNTEAEPGLGSRFGIRSIPTLVVFRKGREVGRQAGAVDLGGLVRWIGAYI